MGSLAACRFAYPADRSVTLLCSLLAGWCLPKRNVESFVQKSYGHQLRPPGFRASRSPRRYFSCQSQSSRRHTVHSPCGKTCVPFSTQHVPWNCSFYFQVLGHSCVTQRTDSTWLGTNNISDVSASLQALWICEDWDSFRETSSVLDFCHEGKRYCEARILTFHQGKKHFFL